MNNQELIPGREYDLWRNGEYIGHATWTIDQNIGPAFISKSDDEFGNVINDVFIADKWELRQ